MIEDRRNAADFKQARIKQIYKSINAKTQKCVLVCSEKY